jgi:ribosome biogenesis GTPase
MKNGKLTMTLQHLGFNEWFAKAFDSVTIENLTPARISEVDKSGYRVIGESGTAKAELTGKFMFAAPSSEQLPTTGDWVCVQYYDDNTLAIIHEILPRKSVLKRKTPGKNIDFQLIAANIDFALIVEAAESNFNLNRIERFLLMVNEGKITPLIILSKSDLITQEQHREIESALDRLKGKYKYQFFSNQTGDGLVNIQHLLQRGKTYCLLGQSGVGKTTLLNTLIGEEVYRVNEVREKDKRGKHTTTRREMVFLDNGAIFIDTPGLREIGNFDVEEGLSITFDDIEALSQNCRFSDCTHTVEKDCAVLQAVEDGNIDKDRYQNYLKIRKEAEYLNRSYVEKRRKDKEFGKMAKNIMKNHIKR